MTKKPRKRTCSVRCQNSIRDKCVCVCEGKGHGKGSVEKVRTMNFIFEGRGSDEAI